MKFIILLTLLLFINSNYHYANTSTREENLIIAATHIQKIGSPGQLPRVTISAADIAARATDSIADLLRGIAGIDIMEQGGVGGLTFLSIRGGDPNFVVILIDGVKVNDPTNSRGGAFDLGTLDPAIIEQIEVYYGSYSTVYGSDALAGVISITTKGVDDNESTTVSLKAGTNNTSIASIHLGKHLGDIAELSFSSSYQNNENSSFGEAFNRKEFNATLASSNQTDNHWRISTFYADGYSESFPEDSGGDRLAVIRTAEKRTYTQKNIVAYFQTQLAENFTFKFNAANSDREEEIANPGIGPGVLDPVPAIDSLSNYKRLDLNSIINYQFSSQSDIAFGIALADETGTMASTIDFGFPMPASFSLERNNKSVFAETVLTGFDKFNIMAGIRHDKTEKISITTNRLINNYQISKTSTASLHYSEGFKLPSFFALGHSLIGNPDLKQEQSKNLELRFVNSHNNNQLNTTVSIYKNRFTNLIDFDPELFTNVNRSKVEAKGIELSTKVIATEQLSVSGQISYNKLDTFEESIVLRRRPKIKTAIQLNYAPIEQLMLTINYAYNDKYFDNSIPTGIIEMDGFDHLDVSASWKFVDTLILHLNILNVLDSEDEETIGFKNMGRSMMFSLSTSF